MDQGKIGRFICGLRREKGMTQKALAKQLGITDKAVSKWERGLSCPDTALLPELSALLGVSVSELLAGERASLREPAYTGPQDKQAAPQSEDLRQEGFGAEEASPAAPALPDASQPMRRGRKEQWRRVGAACFSLLLLLGVLVCGICDLAMNTAFSWSLYPLAACAFTWVVAFPTLWLGAKGIFLSLISFSLAIFPFLAVLDRLIAGGLSILPVGIRMAGLSIGFLWAVFLLFRLLKSRWLAAALSLLMGIPLCALINLSLARLIGEAAVDVWDLLTAAILAALAAACFWRHRRKKSGSPN